MEVKETHTQSCCNHDDDHEVAETTTPRKLPKWAIILAVGSFIVFNAFFLAYAMQLSGNPN